MRPRKYNSPQYDGILLIDKPTDWTSHDVVNLVRRRFRQNKVGHCGTLDPAATGLLVVVIGKGTKLSQALSGDSKTYLGTVSLGSETDSQDAEGEVIATYPVDHITEEMVKGLEEKFTGDIEQVPPMVSALKKDGVPLYKLAREGKEVKRDPRPVTIHELEISNIELPKFDLKAHCSKGTYIRTLAYDMGKALDAGAHLCALRRIQSGQFDIKDAFSIDEIKTWENENLPEKIISLETVKTQ